MRAALKSQASCGDGCVRPAGRRCAMPIHHTAPARRGSVPVAPWQRCRLGTADRSRIMEAARRRERATRCRGSGKHGGELLQTGLRVLWALLYRGTGRAGACDPSLQQIADAAGLVRSTVQEALDRLRAAGILSWVQRGAIVGRRWVQVTNAYAFAPPERWAEARPVSDTGRRQASVSIAKTAWEAGAAGPVPPARTVAEQLAAIAGWQAMERAARQPMPTAAPTAPGPISAARGHCPGPAHAGDWR